MPPFRYLLFPAIAAIAGLVAIYAVSQPRLPGVPDPSLQTEPSAPSSAELTRLAIGQMAAFKVTSPPKALPELTFKDGSGTALTLNDFNGKVVLLNLWATWCAPCLHEMPTLDRLQRALGSKNFEVIALSIDIKGAQAAQKMFQKLKVKNLKLYIDQTTKAARKLNARGMPTTILVDASGRELGRLAGPANWDGPNALRLIRAVLPPSR